MINDYQIKSGINKQNKDELKALSIYLQSVEEKAPVSCMELNEVIENDPKALFEPQKIENSTTFPFVDVAFLYSENEIIGHFIQLFSREQTVVGHKTSVKIIEKYSLIDIQNNFYDDYVMKRLNGFLRLEFKINEKVSQK